MITFVLFPWKFTGMYKIMFDSNGWRETMLKPELPLRAVTPVRLNVLERTLMYTGDRDG